TVGQLSGYGSIEIGNRIGIFHRGIGSIGYQGSGPHELAPDVSTLFGPFWSDPFGDPRSIRCAVDGLHGCYDPKLCKTGNIGGIEMLHVFDPPPKPLEARILLEDGLKDVERFAIGAVSYGVHAKLKITLDGEPCRLE